MSSHPHFRAGDIEKAPSSAMSSPTKDAQPDAICPLTLFDGMYGEVGIAMGWLVEGRIDMKKIEVALDRVISKWPLLGGRLEQERNGLFHLRIPLGPYPDGYKPYIITTRTSKLSLSHYVPLPLPVASDVLPPSIFMDKQTPKSTREWVSRNAPLTYWHATYFEKGDNGSDYSCIGVAFAHSVFDGIGIANVVHAVEAELLGKGWNVPPRPLSGVQQNTLDVLLSNAVKEQEQGKRRVITDYYAGSLASVWYIITFLLWHFWQEKWHNTRSRLILIPKEAYTKMTDDARKAVELEGKVDARLSTGDVLAAFLFKSAFSDGTAPRKRIHVSNLASVRRFFDGQLNDYPHNCIVPMTYPVLTVAEVTTLPLPSLAYRFAQSRKSLSEEDAVEFYKVLRRAVGTSKTATPYDIRADENIMMSNVIIARIVDIDWSGADAGRTVCRYKTILNSSRINFTNVVTIAGKLADGTLVVDVVFNEKRVRVLEDEVEKLIAESKKA
ncbi:hypothetical protein BDZ97DRAFT_1925372 [Flammula alnicola]|nr:hypothetical protein BDZ97DRAFT_1925372 [Flammula alnicola]